MSGFSLFARYVLLIFSQELWQHFMKRISKTVVILRQVSQTGHEKVA